MASNWREVLETQCLVAWAQGVPNPAVPAALKEWSIPIDQLPPEGRRLYEHDVAGAKRLLAEAGYAQRLQDAVRDDGTAMGPDYMDAVQVGAARTGRPPASTTELKLKEYGAFVSSTILGKFDRMAVGLCGGSTDPRHLPLPHLHPGPAASTRAASTTPSSRR